MATTLSCGMAVLVIYVYTVSMTAASNRCTDLVNSCLHKFQQFTDNPLCGELRDAINCLNASDIALCDLSAAIHTAEAEINQSNQHMNSDSKTYQLQREFYQRGNTHQAKPEDGRNDAVINTKTRQHDAESGSHSGLEGAANGNIGSQSNRMKRSDNYMIKLIDVIEEAKEEYKRDCDVKNVGTSTSLIAWSTILVVIGVFATLNM